MVRVLVDLVCEHPGKRVRIEYLPDLGRDLFALLQNGCQAVGEAGYTVSAAAVPGTTTVRSSGAAR